MISPDRFAMPPEAFVTSLYRELLGRMPDPAGLVDWMQLLHETGDPTLLLLRFIDSDEYRNRVAAVNTGPDAIQSLAHRAIVRLGRQPRIVDVGAQSLGAGTHPYSPLLDVTACDIIGFDVLEERLHERAVSEAAHGLTLLHHAIGDGETHTLYVNNEDATSSLFPLNTGFNAMFNHLADLRTVRTELVATRRLDDVLPAGPIDLLKLDIQGAELMALRGAEVHLSQVAAIHCEVEFEPIYAGQPLYGDVHAHLAARGFELIDLLVEGRYHYLVPSECRSPDRLLWANAVFFRITDDPTMRAAQALLAAAMYRKLSFAEHLLADGGSPL